MPRSAFIASVFDKSKPLKGALPEASAVNEIVAVKPGWLCTFLPQVSIGTIGQVFAKQELNFQVFHFAGHAFDEKLQFTGDNSLELEATCLVFPDGLASLVTQFHQLQLVFLNGCSTAAQVKHFRERGVPAVIATQRPLRDDLALLFAQRFYEAFLKSELPLRQAWEQALLMLKGEKGAFTPDWLNPDLASAMATRGLVVDADAGKPVYELFADPVFEKLKWGEWPERSTDAAKPTPSEAAAKAAQRVPEHCVLLCNRSDEVDEFEAALEELLDAPPQLPVFFFIHERETACPLLVTERFERFGVGDFCGQKKLDASRFTWKNLSLPKKRHLQTDALCRRRLTEIYAEHFPHRDAEDRFAFTQPEAPDRVLLLHHNFNFDMVEWHDGLARLLAFYLGDFSQILATEISRRSAVLFSVEYFDETSPFPKFFNDLEAAHPGRVRNLKKLPPIRKEHVGNWRTRIFAGKTDAPDVGVLFPFAVDAPMLEAQKVLAGAVRSYNLKQ